jgi:hypothetical protein
MAWCSIKSTGKTLPFTFTFTDMSCYVGPRNHGMALFWIADGEESQQMLRVAATANKGWCSNLGVGREATKSSPKKTVCYEMLRRVFEWIPWDDLGNVNWI